MSSSKAFTERLRLTVLGICTAHQVDKIALTSDGKSLSIYLVHPDGHEQLVTGDNPEVDSWFAGEASRVGSISGAVESLAQDEPPEIQAAFLRLALDIDALCDQVPTHEDAEDGLDDQDLGSTILGVALVRLVNAGVSEEGIQLLTQSLLEMIANRKLS